MLFFVCAAQAQTDAVLPLIGGSGGGVEGNGRLKTTVNSIGKVTGAPQTDAPRKSICEAARDARARNSPAAPNLEAQCRANGGDSSPKPPPLDAAQQEALAAKGKALANQDPLATELRRQQSNNLARHGFDIGMAVAERETAPGPGKQRIHDSLPADEQPGYRAAVAFSLERNRHGELAATGAAIAEADPTVAEARMFDPDALYRLGFDIATGLFGDPALGATGSTVIGTGALRIRDGLDAGGQRGFNASVKFHLGRDYRRPAGAPAPRPGDSNAPPTEVEGQGGRRHSDGAAPAERQGGRRHGDVSLSNQILCRGSDDKLRVAGSDTELQDFYIFRTISTRYDSTGGAILTVELGGNPAYVAAGSNGAGLREGQCGWLDRPPDGVEGVRIRFEVPANAQLNQARHGTPVDTSPTAAERFPDAFSIPDYFRDENHYWIFTAYDTGRGYLQATDGRYWKRTPGLSDGVTQPTDTRGVKNQGRVLNPTKP